MTSAKEIGLSPISYPKVAANPFVVIVRLFRLRRRLRKLQRAYYRASKKEDALIIEYFQTLAVARQIAVPHSIGRCLHLGCGEHRIDGWINIDIARSTAVDLQTDLTRELPFRDNSIEYIHSEDLIEHLDLESGHRLLSECFRILRPGGVMRLLTPDLWFLVQSVYLRPQAHHLAWCWAQLQAKTPCEALNMHCRMGGEHRFIYDFPYLKSILTGIGFRVSRVSWNRSRSPVLRYLDLRDFGLNLFLEARKPPPG